MLKLLVCPRCKSFDVDMYGLDIHCNSCGWNFPWNPRA